MWLFLFTEMLLFGGLFVLYSAYRARNAHAFHECGQHLNHVIGVANTFVLLTSSLTMALSITAVQRGQERRSMLFVAITIVLGLVFLVNKGFEWAAEFQQGIYPGSELLMEHADGPLKGEGVFYGLYFTMTGLHGLHVIAGLVLLTVMWFLLRRGRVNKDDFILLENSGLYWHLVDVIWIFLLPLFYLAA
jgi:cytochrome c oxidase subunit 3